MAIQVPKKEGNRYKRVATFLSITQAQKDFITNHYSNDANTINEYIQQTNSKLVSIYNEMLKAIEQQYKANLLFQGDGRFFPNFNAEALVTSKRPAL